MAKPRRADWNSVQPFYLLLFSLAVFYLPSGECIAENPVELQIITNIVEGQGEAGLLLIANEAVKEAELRVLTPEGERDFRSGEIAKGGRKLIAIPQKAGRVSYSGRLIVTFENGETGETPLNFELNVLEGLKIAVNEELLDLSSRKAAFSASRPLSRVEYSILADTGDILDSGEIDYKNRERKPDDVYLFSWGGADGTVIRIDLTAYDLHNTYSKLELSPWFVDVEHEEVNFPTGSDRILPEEAPKLDRAYEHLREAIRKYGRLVRLNLYIVGYTDSVGKPDYNLKLSGKRARSIARYMKKKGFRFPIFYQGFGEEVLAVPTADETDELKNRRALYLLGGDYCPKGGQIPRSDWVQLQ